MKGAGVSITKVRSFLKLFDNLDISKNEALKKAGINEKTLLSPDNRLAYEEVNNLFKLAVKLTDDIDIGLKQGFQLDKGFSNILGYILMNCKTLGEAAEKFTEYEQLVHELSRTELECKKHELHI
ncbi:MAG: AraC family transcriptional regulator ligand-binding domain-containing protein, partial [bacterium]